MADRKESECDFELKGLRFRYQKNFKAFICDQKDVLAILRHNYPSSYDKIVVSHPELRTAGKSEEEAKKEDGLVRIEYWKEADIKEVKDAGAQVKDGKDADEPQMAGNRKAGVISRLSKGIKKIIARITPTKLRKRWNLEDEDARNNVPAEKHQLFIKERSLIHFEQEH